VKLTPGIRIAIGQRQRSAESTDRLLNEGARSDCLADLARVGPDSAPPSATHGGLIGVGSGREHRTGRQKVIRCGWSELWTTVVDARLPSSSFEPWSVTSLFCCAWSRSMRRAERHANAHDESLLALLRLSVLECVSCSFRTRAGSICSKPLLGEFPLCADSRFALSRSACRAEQHANDHEELLLELVRLSVREPVDDANETHGWASTPNALLSGSLRGEWGPSPRPIIPKSTSGSRFAKSNMRTLTSRALYAPRSAGSVPIA
jgi:hypothetical protein